MSYVHAAALDWARRALAEQLRDDSPQIATRTQNFVGIAEHYNVPIEELISWIYREAPGKQWTAAEWRRCCEQYSGLRRRLGFATDGFRSTD